MDGDSFQGSAAELTDRGRRIKGLLPVAELSHHDILWLLTIDIHRSIGTKCDFPSPGIGDRLEYIRYITDAGDISVLPATTGGDASALDPKAFDKLSVAEILAILFGLIRRMTCAGTTDAAKAGELADKLREQHNGIMAVHLYLGHDGDNQCRLTDYNKDLATGSSGVSLLDAVELAARQWGVDRLKAGAETWTDDLISELVGSDDSDWKSVQTFSTSNFVAKLNEGRVVPLTEEDAVAVLSADPGVMRLEPGDKWFRLPPKWKRFAADESTDEGPIPVFLNALVVMAPKETLTRAEICQLAKQPEGSRIYYRRSPDAPRNLLEGAELSVYPGIVIDCTASTPGAENEAATDDPNVCRHGLVLFFNGMTRVLEKTEVLDASKVRSVAGAGETSAIYFRYQPQGSWRQWAGENPAAGMEFRCTQTAGEVIKVNGREHVVEYGLLSPDYLRGLVGASTESRVTYRYGTGVEQTLFSGWINTSADLIVTCTD